jgi:hypothetical protein
MQAGADSEQKRQKPILHSTKMPVQKLFRSGKALKKPIQPGFYCILFF